MTKSQKRDFNPYIPIPGKVSIRPQVEYIEILYKVYKNGTQIGAYTRKFEKGVEYVSISQKLRQLKQGNLSPTEIRLLDYLITNATPDKGTIVLDPDKLSFWFNKKRSAISGAITNFCKMDVLTRKSPKKYWINPEYCFVGDKLKYIEEVNPNHLKCVRKHVKDIYLD